MNIYFLVEGKRTERKVYPAWLAHLVPELARVRHFDEVKKNNYFIFSGEGYPSILQKHLPNAVRDVNRVGTYDYLVICLDADESSRSERESDVMTALAKNGLTLWSTQLQVIVQDRCIETWFLGNRRIISRNPQSEKLRDYLEFYDVRQSDPEAMSCHPDFELHSPFHGSYIGEVFRERQMKYSKVSPGHVLDRPFLDELINRTVDSPTHLASFRTLLTFLNDVSSRVSRFD